MKPLSDNILIRPLKTNEKSPGGIILPDIAKDQPVCTGKVVAIGPGRVLDNGQVFSCRVAVGDNVVYANYSGFTIAISGEDHRVVRESDLLGVME